MSCKVHHDNRAERCGGTDAEPLYRCGGCLREGFTMRGMNSHRCQPSAPQIFHPAGETATTKPKKDTRNMAPKTATRNPADLKPHPLFAKTHHPMMSRDNPAWAALVESIREQGVLQPIFITETNLVVDGRHRAAAAAEAEVSEVPVQIVAESEVPMIIAATIIHRRHYTKSARSYLVAPLAEAATGSGKKSRIANLRQNSPNPDSDPVREEGSGNTLQTFAREMGVSEDLLRQARDIHARLDKIGDKKVADPDTKQPVTVRERVDAMLLEEGCGFQPVLAMLGYIAAGNKAQGQALKDKRAEYGRLAAEKFDRLTDNFGNWERTDAVEREVVYQAIPQVIPKWPLDVCQRLWTELSKRRDEWAGKA